MRVAGDRCGGFDLGIRLGREGDVGWVICFSIMAIAGTVGVVANVNRLRFERRVGRERGTLLAVPPSPLPQPPALGLPAPVERYRALAVGDRAPVRTMRLTHGGTFRLKANAAPLAIRGAQLFTADPPGFLWTGRIRMAPGVWVDARDMAVAGAGSMRVLLESTVQLADASGPELDQGSALRLLAELVWLPTALFDARYVTWAPVDADHARATLRLGKVEVSALFEFGADGLPTGVTAHRFMDKGGLKPWGGLYRDWRTVSGLRVPFEADVDWRLPTGTFTYAHWLLDALDYDGAEDTACAPARTTL